MKNNKISILKKIIGRKMFIIDNIKTHTGYMAQIIDVKDENHVLIQNENSELIPINIFDIRSIPYEW